MGIKHALEKQLQLYISMFKCRSLLFTVWRSIAQFTMNNGDHATGKASEVTLPQLGKYLE